MDNQHRKIKGYRDLSQAEIDLMNEIKTKGEELGAIAAKVRAHIKAQRANTGEDQTDEIARLKEAEPERWASIGITSIQEGLMALTRAVAQPVSF